MQSATQHSCSTSTACLKSDKAKTRTVDL